MAKIKVEDLAKIRERVRATTALREGGPYKAKVIVHMGTCGIACGARKIMRALLKEIGEKGVKDLIVTTSGCAGLCSREPMATVEVLGMPPVKYVDLTEQKIRRIFNEHIRGGNIVSEYALPDSSERQG